MTKTRPITDPVQPDIPACMALAAEQLKKVTTALAMIADTVITVQDQALCLAIADEIGERVHAIRQSIVDDLADSLEADVETSVGWLTRVKMSPKESWRLADTRDAARPEFVQRLATNPETGEVLPQIKRAVLNTMRLYETVFSVGKPKAAFRTDLGLDVDEFRTVEDRGYTVELRQPSVPS